MSEKGWVRTLKRPRRGSLGPGLQDRRQARLRVLCGDHLETFAVRDHPGKFYSLDVIKDAGRGAAMASRSACSSTWSRTPTIVYAIRQQGRTQIPGREPRRTGFCRQGRRIASATPARASRYSTSRTPNEACAITMVAGDTVAAIGDEPQDGAVPARPGAGDGARPRRALAEIFQDAKLSDVAVFDARGRPDLEGFRRPRAE